MAINSHQLSKDLLERFGHQSGEELLSIMTKDIFPGKLCLVSSFGSEAALLLDMVSRIDKKLPVVFLDTQKLFPETLEYRDQLIAHFNLKDVRTYYPDYNNVSRSDPEGILWQSDVNACCYMRKVEPLQRALKGFDAWITGRKRFHGSVRKDIPLIESADGRVKINPLASWSREDIGIAFEERGIPRHPLVEQGYLSIGCAPCTSLPENADDVRSGRWQGQDKDECGIHLGDDGRFHRSGT